MHNREAKTANKHIQCELSINNQQIKQTDMKRIKISNLTLKDIIPEGCNHVYMRYTPTDMLRDVSCQRDIDEIKSNVIAVFGDVDVVVDHTRKWNEQIIIDDQEFISRYEQYMGAKAEWCNKYGCN